MQIGIFFFTVKGKHKTSVVGRRHRSELLMEDKVPLLGEDQRAAPLHMYAQDTGSSLISPLVTLVLGLVMR